MLGKMLVAIETLVGRKERMWQRRDSDRLLILSTAASFLAMTIINSQENSLLSLLSGCPVLEYLSFTVIYFVGEYRMCVPTLKSLNIREDQMDCEDRRVYKLGINALALKYFN